MADRIYAVETTLSDDEGRALSITYEDCLNSVLGLIIEDSNHRAFFTLNSEEAKLLIGCLTYMSKALPSNKETPNE